MRKILFVLFCSFFSITVGANYPPSVGNRPHTICWEKENRFPGIQVYLTDLRAKPVQTQVEIKEFSPQGERQVLRQITEVQLQEAFEVYETENLKLEISQNFLSGSSQRPAHLIYFTEGREEIRRDLLCDSLMYPMGKGPASF